MKLANATNFNRKFGEAEGSAVLRTIRGNFFRKSEPGWIEFSRRLFSSRAGFASLTPREVFDQHKIGALVQLNGELSRPRRRTTR
jgi:hypothetical protein